MPDWDAIVCGGGAAGLVLAAELAGPGAPLDRILVVDDAARPVRDRTWAFWAARDTLVDGVTRGCWSHLAVHVAGASHVLDIAPYSYRLVDGDALTILAEERVAAAGRDLERLTGTVESVATVPGPGEPVAEVVVDGVRITAEWAFDSRPPPAAQDGEPVMRFEGRQVVTDEPVFDPAVATFMDFRAGGPGTVRFGYVLPLSHTQALVDVVAIVQAEPSRGPVDHSRHVDDYLDLLLGATPRRTLLHEAAEVPLREEPPRRAFGRVLAVGRRGGLLRPSTGFAFDRIMRDGERIARSLGTHGHPFHGLDSLSVARQRFLDRVFLDVALREPDEIERAFAALFARNPPQRVLAFLDGDAAGWEDAALITTLPPAAFVKAARRRAARLG